MDGNLLPPPLIIAGNTLAEGGVYGLVWLDRELDVTAKFGQLVADIEIGEPVTQSIPALFGYEADILAMSENPIKPFILPGISMPTHQNDNYQNESPRLNISAYWSKPDERYILLVARATSASNADVFVSQQMRSRLMAEEALAQKSRELEIANRDLEEYAEIISHDLSAPLRAIRYLTEDIEAAIDIGDNQAARENLVGLSTQTKRMSQMMTALLDYASLGRKSDHRELVATKQLVEEVIRSLPRPKNLVVNIAGDWPTITTMRAPLDLVIRNLVDNAIKHHDRDNGTITIEASNDEGKETFRFMVRDDGPGIEPKHHDAVLMPFRTLDDKPAQSSNDSQTSHGMGLALVKRTVDSIGGTFSLRSNPAKSRGSEFSVIWPVRT